MEKVTYFSTEGKRFFRHDGKCFECNIVKQTIKRHKIDGDWQYDFTLTVSNNGREYDIMPEDLFKSVEDFERNLPHEPECVFQPGIRFGTNGVCFYVKDSQVLNFDINTNWRTLIYDGMEWTCPELPEKCYNDIKEACAGNIVRIVDNNGVETEKVGVNLLLRLNDEQRVILNDIENVYKKAKDAGIVFFYDTDYDRVYAVNKRNVEDIFSCYEQQDEDYEEAPIWKEEEFKADIPINPSFCDNILWIKRKSSEKQA